MTVIRNGAYVQGTTQNFATSLSSQNSNVVGNTTGIIRVATNQDTWVNVATPAFYANGTVSSNIVAYTANAMLIPAGGVEFFAATENKTQVAFLAVATVGNISITELG